MAVIAIRECSDPLERSCLAMALRTYNMQAAPGAILNAPRRYDYMAIVEGSIAGGVLAVEELRGCVYITHLYLADQYRRQGIGTELLAELECAAGAAHVTPCTLAVDTFEWQAREFYEKNGFAVVGELRCAPGMTRYYLSKNICGRVL